MESKLGKVYRWKENSWWKWVSDIERKKIIKAYIDYVVDRAESLLNADLEIFI